MQYLVKEVTVLKEGPLFQVGVYVLKGECVPINLLIIYYRLSSHPRLICHESTRGLHFWLVLDIFWGWGILGTGWEGIGECSDGGFDLSACCSLGIVAQRR